MVQSIFEIGYNQIVVFDALLDHPFNDWNKGHLAQGFAWREGSVSFAMLDNGTLTVQVFYETLFDATLSKAVRIIAVPFFVPEHTKVEIASVSSSIPLQFLPGNYELIFEHGLNNKQEMWANFYFIPSAVTSQARILRADPLLLPAKKLLMVADPA